jgi:hypothetical protein
MGGGSSCYTFLDLSSKKSDSSDLTPLRSKWNNTRKTKSTGTGIWPAIHRCHPIPICHTSVPSSPEWAQGDGPVRW